MLLIGPTGVGKTFLLNCVAQRVLARGFSVAFVGAYRMSEIMRQNQFDGSNADLVNEFLTCDLLCVDDLGSEPMRRETTVSGFYYILNERTNAGKAFAVSTNCTPQQLYARDGDRVAARLCDPGRKAAIFSFSSPSEPVRMQYTPAAPASSSVRSGSGKDRLKRFTPMSM